MSFSPQVKNFLNQPKKIVLISQDCHEDSVRELIRVEHLEHSKCSQQVPCVFAVYKCSL